MFIINEHKLLCIVSKLKNRIFHFEKLKCDIVKVFFLNQLSPGNSFDMEDSAQCKNGIFLLNRSVHFVNSVTFSHSGDKNRLLLLLQDFQIQHS